MLLAGIGDPAAADARFIAMQGDRLALWLGQSSGQMLAADSALNASDWHFAAAVGDGNKITLYVDGKAVASGLQGRPGARTH